MENKACMANCFGWSFWSLNRTGDRWDKDMALSLHLAACFENRHYLHYFHFVFVSHSLSRILFIFLRHLSLHTTSTTTTTIFHSKTILHLPLGLLCCLHTHRRDRNWAGTGTGRDKTDSVCVYFVCGGVWAGELRLRQDWKLLEGDTSPPPLPYKRPTFLHARARARLWPPAPLSPGLILSGVAQLKTEKGMALVDDWRDVITPLICR